MSEGQGLEQLWAGWRHEYVASATAAERAGEDGGCVFCRIAASGPPSEDNCVVWRGELTFAVMNACGAAERAVKHNLVRLITERVCSMPPPPPPV